MNKAILIHQLEQHSAELKEKAEDIAECISSLVKSKERGAPSDELWAVFGEFYGNQDVKGTLHRGHAILNKVIVNGMVVEVAEDLVAVLSRTTSLTCQLLEALAIIKGSQE